MAINLFGYTIKRKDEKNQSFVEPNLEDGAVQVDSSPTGVGGYFGTAMLDIAGTARSEADLIMKYRQLEHHHEVSRAIEDIVNEAIVVNSNNRVVDINLDDVKLSDNIKKRLIDEFQNVLSLLDFSNKGYELFHRWYVDGRLRFHTIVNENEANEGIKELRYVDPRKLRRVREIETVKPENVNSEISILIKKIKNDYWIYNDQGFGGKSGETNSSHSSPSNSATTGIKIARDSIVEVNSGILSENNNLILSHLHKALKAHNQLKLLEDAAVIYRLARAPERRVFYIDVGNLPKAKAEQHLYSMMTKHKNKLVYDASSGSIKDQRHNMTLMEDFWLPRREGGRSTEIDTLPGGQNLGEMEDIVYFQKNLYKALNVPTSRMESDTGFSLGRASEISRDEVKFSKFIQRLRARFAILFDELMERQVVLKKIMSLEEWRECKNRIRYDYAEDNYFSELKQMEIFRERISTLQDADQFIGNYFSKNWIRKNVLFMADDEIEEIDKQIAAEEPDEDENDSNDSNETNQNY